VLTAVKIQVEVFWVVTLGSVVVGYQCFGGLSRLHLHCCVMAGYQIFGGLCRLHLQYRVVVGYQRFRRSCYLSEDGLERNTCFRKEIMFLVLFEILIWGGGEAVQLDSISSFGS
jgi:hypothetical protein